MPARHLKLLSSLTLLNIALFISLALSGPTDTESALTLDRSKRNNNHLDPGRSLAPNIQDGPPFSAGALRDTKYLPAQIAGLIAAYGVSLVLVAITLLLLSKKRREHLQSGKGGGEEEAKSLFGTDSPIEDNFPFRASNPPRGVPTNFSYPAPLQTRLKHQPLPSHDRYPGVSPAIDQSFVSTHTQHTLQSQLEDMYRHAMEQEDARQRGSVSEVPVDSGSSHRISSFGKSVASPRKDRVKPANLDLNAAAHEDKTRSKASSFFASLRSPRKKQIRGLNISSPLMTPHSGASSRHELQEMYAIPPRHYAPPPPPPIPTDQIPFGAQVRNSHAPPPAPNGSPESIQSIDQRINTQLDPLNVPHSASEVDPVSASSEHSQTPLMGLPSSPKPGARTPTQASSSKPGASFSRANAPSAVRTGGKLPLRAYEPAESSTSTTTQTTKQTVFERRGPLSPTAGRTPMTAGAVPYSPYQPYTPVIPITPSLVTKEDRKRMKKMVPKTPTMEMVKDSDEIW
ncbi:hypothetical protein E4U41_005203 [Claviceps citrina]|nr:hypothetical protein E4U41_005203 [Claviceps citrina]